MTVQSTEFREHRVQSTGFREHRAQIKGFRGHGVQGRSTKNAGNRVDNTGSRATGFNIGSRVQGSIQG